MSEALVNDAGQLDATAIANTSAGPWCSDALQSGQPIAAAAAIIIGRDRLAGLNVQLVALLDDEGLTGRAAAWTLGRLGAQNELIQAASEGGLDVREHAYLGLVVLISQQLALDQQPAADLGDALCQCVSNELQRAKSGRSGLGEQACRALATLGDKRSLQEIQNVIEGDPLTDRFELQRLRKACEEQSYDAESRNFGSAPWQDFFADYVAPAAVIESDETPSPTAEEMEAAFLAESELAEQTPAVNEFPDQEQADDGELPIDVKAYLATKSDPNSPELKLVQQVIPMLQQLSEQAVQVPLHLLAAQEFALLILQVLPQALPPQYIQALLSPQAINALSSLFRWHKQQGGSPALLEGLGLVRQQLQEQVRASGMLGGPDFSDPEENKLPS